jgi:hypothetical protein
MKWRGGGAMTRKAKKGVPALQNEDVTGMTEERQEEIARETGRGPREDAAERFNKEQQRQAVRTPPAKD